MLFKRYESTENGRRSRQKSYCSIPEIATQHMVHFSYIQGIQYTLHSCTGSFGSWYSNTTDTISITIAQTWAMDDMEVILQYSRLRQSKPYN